MKFFRSATIVSRPVVAGSLLAFALGTAMGNAWSQAPYPSKPVRIIVPAGPGGVTDLQARLAANKLTKTLGQNFLVENRPGAGTTLGTNLVAKAQPDGYTLLCMTGSFTTAAVTYAKLPYDPINDLVPVSQFAVMPYLLVVNPNVPARNVKEFIAYAKANPGKLNYSTTGNGTLAHLSGLWLETLAGIKVTQVPYKDVAAQISDLVQGRVDVTIATPSNVLAHINSGKLRGLAWTSAERSRMLPNLPTTAEQGLTEFKVNAMVGFWAPKGTPAPIVNRLSAALKEAAKDPDIISRLGADGTDMVGSTPEEFRKIVVTEIDRWGKLVKESGMELMAE
jgi:tripartite-type tricarboxylate transporter receptor subunit TctC